MHRTATLLFALLLSGPACGLWGSAGAQPALVPSDSSPSAQVWLGVFLGDAVDGGVQVVAVSPRGPASRAGVAAGDVVVELNGQPVPDREAFRRAVAGLRAGDRAVVRLLRGGRVEERWVEPEGRDGSSWREWIPPSAGGTGASQAEALGVSVLEIPDDLRQHFGAPADAGVLVAAVAPTGSDVEVQVGDILLRAGGRPVRTSWDWITLASRPISGLEVVRDRKRVLVQLPKRGPAQGDRAASLREELLRLRGKIEEIERELERLQQGEH